MPAAPTATLPVAPQAPAIPHPDVRQVVSASGVSAAAGTLARAFFDDPVLTWTFPDPLRRWERLPGVFELYAGAFARHGATYATPGGTGAALWLPPGRELLAVDEEDAFARELEERAGEDAERLLALMALLEEHHPEGRFAVLQLLAVEPQWQGRGVGSRLLESALARWDAERVPSYLEATSSANARLYERHGFEVVGEISLPDGPSLLPMWREPA